MADQLHLRRVTTGEQVTAYTVLVSCPRCGGRLGHVASGTPGLDTRAIVCCSACRRHWALVVTLADVTDELSRPHGLDDVHDSARVEGVA